MSRFTVFFTDHEHSHMMRTRKEAQTYLDSYRAWERSQGRHGEAAHVARLSDGGRWDRG